MRFRNFLLAALNAADLADLQPRLSELTLSRGQVLFEPGDSVDTLYFPGSACISVVTAMEDGKEVETTTIGRESVVGLVDAMAGKPTRSRIFTQIGGGAMSLPATVYRARMRASPSLNQLSWRHARANAFQAERGVACNIAHPANGRLARWLLMTHDRTGGERFDLTQDYMAVMAGVQRTTVSQIANQFKKMGIIDYSRGGVVIRDRPALIRQACECYALIGEQFEDLKHTDAPAGG
ncbi:MAG: transcriptional regulator, Crp/Fnr family [Caulobacteraceae bacterium]|nr:transcriptional regulator, Crp/Fnr family [Caulobacteraceae bacterium]